MTKSKPGCRACGKYHVGRKCGVGVCYAITPAAEIKEALGQKRSESMGFQKDRYHAGRLDAFSEALRILAAQENDDA